MNKLENNIKTTSYTLKDYSNQITFKDKSKIMKHLTQKVNKLLVASLQLPPPDNCHAETIKDRALKLSLSIDKLAKTVTEEDNKLKHSHKKTIKIIEETRKIKQLGEEVQGMKEGAKTYEEMLKRSKHIGQEVENIVESVDEILDLDTDQTRKRKKLIDASILIMKLNDHQITKLETALKKKIFEKGMDCEKEEEREVKKNATINFKEVKDGH